MGPVDPEDDKSSSDPIDRLVIDLRAYVIRPADKKTKARAQKPIIARRRPNESVLVFDCETRTTPDQRLRFGAYQLRYKGVRRQIN